MKIAFDEKDVSVHFKVPVIGMIHSAQCSPIRQVQAVETPV